MLADVNTLRQQGPSDTITPSCRSHHQTHRAARAQVLRVRRTSRGASARNATVLAAPLIKNVLACVPARGGL
jgi:hypothetical protein